MVVAAYCESVRTFKNQMETGTIMNSIQKGYLKNFGRNPTPKDQDSWPATHRKIEKLLHSEKFNDCILMFEVRLSSINKQTADVVILGADTNGNHNLIIIEMKQWTKTRPSAIHTDIETPLGRGYTSVHHPAIQAKEYLDLIRISEAECDLENENRINTFSFVWLFNMPEINSSPLFADRFHSDLRDIGDHIYLEADLQHLRNVISFTIDNGQGDEVLARLSNTVGYNPSSLAAHARANLPGLPIFTLIGIQSRINRQIQDLIESLDSTPGKQVIIIQGGPGSGKTAVAIESAITSLGNGKKVRISTTAAGFMSPLRRYLSGTLLDKLLVYPMTFVTPFQQGLVTGGAEDDEYDMVIVDESHRMHPYQLRYGHTHIRKDLRSGLNSAEEIIRSSRITVFIHDEDQIINPECTTLSTIIKAAESFLADVTTYTLPYHFRGAGSSRFREWLEHLMYPERGNPFPLYVDGVNEPMAFSIVDDPMQFLTHIKPAPSQDDTRIVAGYCWKWNKRTRRSNPLPLDVVISNHNPGNKYPIVKSFKAPWEDKNRADTWAIRDDGRDELGCIYTIQGLDFNRICIIWPLDLQWNPESKQWMGYPGRTAHSGRETNSPELYDNWDGKLQREDENSITLFLQNVYYTLLTRGNSEVSVFFMDGNTRRYFEDWLR